VSLCPGVSVCLFTDGLEDAQVGEGRLGRAEVVRLLSAHETPDAARLLDDVRERADLVADDTAALVLNCRGT
jgi:serine phosphatase RsbU (regulator of sigma subunit)